MDIKNFQIATWSFVQNYIKPNLTKDIDKWVLYFGMGFGTLAFQKKLNEYFQIMKQMGLIDQNNQINLNDLQKYGKFAFEKQSKVKIWKFTFCQTDFEEYINCLKKGDTTILKQ